MHRFQHGGHVHLLCAVCGYMQKALHLLFRLLLSNFIVSLVTRSYVHQLTSCCSIHSSPQMWRERGNKCRDQTGLCCQIKRFHWVWFIQLKTSNGLLWPCESLLSIQHYSSSANDGQDEKEQLWEALLYTVIWSIKCELHVGFFLPHTCAI